MIGEFVEKVGWAIAEGRHLTVRHLHDSALIMTVIGLVESSAKWARTWIALNQPTPSDDIVNSTVALWPILFLACSKPFGFTPARTHTMEPVMLPTSTSQVCCGYQLCVLHRTHLEAKFLMEVHIFKYSVSPFLLCKFLFLLYLPCGPGAKEAPNSIL